MNIRLKNIQQLFFNSQNILKESNHTYCLTGCTRLENAPIPYLMNLLYVCEYNEDFKNFNFTPNMHILCLIGEHTNLEKMSEEFHSSINILFLKNENSKAIYTELLEYFDTQCGISLFADTMIEILSAEGGIQSIIDHAYNAFENPIFVFDTGFKLIAANWEEAKNANAGVELIENGGFSDKEFKMVNSRNHIHKRVMKSEVPIMSYNPELGYEQLFCAINTRKDLGHIVVSAANRPLNPIDSQLLQILKKCIDQQLKKDEFIRNTKGFNYEYFLKDLLDGNIGTRKSIIDRMGHVCSEFSGNMYCFVIETACSSSTINTYRIRNLFENSFSNTKTLMYNGEIIAILRMPKSHLLPKNYLNDAIRICKENDLYAGLSNCFQNIIEFSEYYKQALHAIELGICSVNKPNLFLYEDYYLEHLINIFVQKESSKTFCNTKMKLLMDYDKKHDSELAYTLYMYLINERNIAAASTAMHLHRNSIVYRIKKINSLIGDDYESYSERQYLILSYKLLIYNEN